MTTKTQDFLSQFRDAPEAQFGRYRVGTPGMVACDLVPWSEPLPRALILAQVEDVQVMQNPNYKGHERHGKVIEVEWLFAAQRVPVALPAPSIQDLAAGAFYPQVTGFTTPAPKQGDAKDEAFKLETDPDKIQKSLENYYKTGM